MEITGLKQGIQWVKGHPRPVPIRFFTYVFSSEGTPSVTGWTLVSPIWSNGGHTV